MRRETRLFLRRILAFLPPKSHPHNQIRHFSLFLLFEEKKKILISTYFFNVSLINICSRFKTLSFINGWASVYFCRSAFKTYLACRQAWKFNGKTRCTGVYCKMQPLPVRMAGVVRFDACARIHINRAPPPHYLKNHERA